MRKILLGAAAAVGALVASSSASAATVFIAADHLATTNYIVTLGGTVNGNPFNLQVFESPDVLTASFDGGPLEQVLVFCVDIFHLFDSTTPPITYETGPVDTDSSGALSGNGNPLSHVISGELGYLAGLANASSTAADLAAIQGAIWLTEYSGLTISGGSPLTAQYQALGAQWAADHAGYNSYANGIYDVDGHHQGFVLGGVPEPSTWALMIGGFGLAGAMLRRRRSLAA